jgi:hypothetical protein
MTNRGTETLTKNQTAILSRKVMKKVLGGMRTERLGHHVLPITFPPSSVKY